MSTEGVPAEPAGRFFRTMICAQRVLVVRDVDFMGLAGPLNLGRYILSLSGVNIYHLN
ncbi:MAG: hypothetical protein KJP23_31300 [Deltaproteobacteria bacterium]|nr:hypothetical protein [Deltaproteobacteria bacterium]